MSGLPATFTRPQILAAFEALGLDALPDDAVASISIDGTQVDVEMFVPDEDGGMIHMLGEFATIVVTIPIDEGD